METLTLNQVLSLVSAVHLIPVFAALKQWNAVINLFVVGDKRIQIRVSADTSENSFEYASRSEFIEVMHSYLLDHGFCYWGKSQTVFEINFPFAINPKSSEIPALVSLYGCQSIDDLTRLCGNIRLRRDDRLTYQSHGRSQLKFSIEQMVHVFLVHAFRILVGDWMISKSWYKSNTNAEGKTFATTYAKCPGVIKVKNRHEELTIRTFKNELNANFTTTTSPAVHCVRSAGIFSTSILLHSTTSERVGEWCDNLLHQ